MNKEQLNSVLEKHKKWLDGEDGGERADLRGTNLRCTDMRDANLRDVDLRDARLRGTDLRGTDMRGTNLRGTDMRDADLRGADLDYSCWPLWCGSLGATIDDRIARQLLYHVLSVIWCSPVSRDIKDAALTPELLAVANAFHRAQDNECKKIGGNKDDERTEESR